MTDTILKIPAIRDPAEAARAIAEHVAAIDALLNGVRWNNDIADAYTQDAQRYLTEVADCVKRAVELEGEWHRERGA